MRSKLPKRCWLSLGVFTAGLLAAAPAQALTFVPYGYVNTVVDDDNTGSPTAVYFLDTTYAGTISSAAGYSEHDFNGTLNGGVGETFTFAVTGAAADPTNTPYLWIYAEDATTSGQYKEIPVGCGGITAGINGGCNSGTTDSFLITLNFKTICGTIANVRGCDAGSVDVNSTDGTLSGIRMRAVLGTASPPTSSAAAAGTLLKVIPQIDSPAITPDSPALPGFFPGDTSIFVETGGVIATANTTSASSPVFLRTFVSANLGPSNLSPMSATVLQAVSYNSGRQEISGFENSTTESGMIEYTMKLGVEDSAGAIAFSTTDYVDVFATDIQGFLRESNCFVATASYRDGRATGVMLLRNFRDDVLSRFDLGRAFIAGYYRYGPIAADWLIEHPIFRSATLMGLLPVQALAWIALNPAALLLPLFALVIFLGYLAQGTTVFGFFLALALFAAPRAGAVDQPYIDSLVSGLPAEPARTTENPDPFIQSEKRKLGAAPGDDSTGYTEEIRKQIGARDGSEGFTDRARREIPKAEGSAIEDYRRGKKLRANKGELDTRSAFGFNLMASANRTYTAGANQDIEYGTVYGNGWVPDFTLHYEWRPFTWSILKKFGLYTSAGASFTSAQGVLDYQDTRFGSESQTQFRFIMIPANVGLIYRFSLFDFMWPYFAGGPSAIGVIENRNDKQSGQRGYTFGYWFTGGIAFGLDWISPKSSWSQYETAGIKHSYFSIEYSYLESLGGGLVEFTVDGVKAGFTFEL